MLESLISTHISARMSYLVVFLYNFSSLSGARWSFEDLCLTFAFQLYIVQCDNDVLPESVLIVS